MLLDVMNKGSIPYNLAIYVDWDPPICLQTETAFAQHQ